MGLPAAAAAQAEVVRLPERDRALAGDAPVAFSIGRAEGADHELFGQVAAVAFDAADNLYVLDRQAARVMVYDRTGRFVRQVGSRGQGPAELGMPLSMAVAPDGTVAVADLAKPGIVLYRPDGTLLRGDRLEGMVPGMGSPLAWHPRGGLVGIFRQMAAGTPGTSVDRTVPLLFRPLDGGAPVRIFDVPQTWMTEQSSPGEGRIMVRVTGPPEFAPLALFGVLPDGNLALSFTTGYTMRIVDPQGRTLRYVQRPLRPRLTTEADRERARERRREAMQSGDGVITIARGGGGGAPAPRVDRGRLEAQLQEMRFADTIRAIQGMRVAPSGTIWVERTPPELFGRGPIDLVTPSGEYRGTLTGIALPDAISRGGLAAFIERDELDVPVVVVRRLPEGWR
jgi:hypothetical protein